VREESLGTVRIAVIRAWEEPGAAPHQRIRITFADATPGAAMTTTVVTAADELCRVLRRWLTDDEAAIGPGATETD
jgi:hypothetical protein